jgi:PKD repeat protein
MKINMFTICVFTLFSTVVFGQKNDNIWLFGIAGGDQSSFDSTGVTMLDFSNGNKPVVIEKEPYTVNFTGTNTSMCDSAGNLLFYTNGEHVYSNNHKIMSNGTKIAAIIDGYGYRLPQGAIALPYPTVAGMYVLLTIEQYPNDALGYKLFYHTIDMSKNNGLGLVTAKRQLLVQDSLSWGKISATKHANGQDWWFVVPHKFSNIYYIGLLTPDGIRMDTCSIGEIVYDGLGQSTFSPDGCKYAKVDSKNSLTADQISLFDFDRCTGRLSNYRTHFLNDPNTFGIGCAFSKDSKYLYVNNTLIAYQYDVTSTDVFSTETVVAEWDGTLHKGIWRTNFYLAQLAPDGRILINTTNSSRSMHIINFPNNAGSACSFVQNALQTPTGITYEMPNFPNYRLGPLDGSACDTLGLDNHPLARWRWEQEDTLQPLSITFTDLSDYEPANWYWTFGDGQSSTAQYPVHAYDAKGVYTVCLVVSNANSADTLCRVLELGVSGTGSITETIPAGLSPNPFTDRLSVSLNASVRSPMFHLYDATGRLVRTESLVLGINELETPGLPSGMYFWRVESAGEVLQRGKCLKMK